MALILGFEARAKLVGGECAAHDPQNGKNVDTELKIRNDS